MDPYVDALIKEIESYRESISDIKTIYIGGGTPSLLEGRHLEKIVEALNVPIVEEFTIEVNPESVKVENLEKYRELGINRISMGVQTTDNQLLKTIGRRHVFQDVEKAVGLIRGTGFDNLNLDLIYGLPGQTTDSIKRDVKKILKLNPEHLSTYSLTIDEGTIFRQRKVQSASDELDREMFHTIREMVIEAGMSRYEISNFAKPGFESRHNLLYWRCNEYIGLGAGAHGYLNDERYGNIDSINEYMARIELGKSAIQFTETIDQAEKIFEYIILNLRTTDGFDPEEFKSRFGFDFLERYKTLITQFTQHNAMKIQEGRVFLTPYGLDISNAIDQAFR